MISYPNLNKADTLASLPGPWPQELFPGIREAVNTGKDKIVILDDDPTGTQTVHGLPVLTTWDVRDLEKELKNPGPGFFILTNSRCMPAEQADKLAAQIGRNLKTASSATGVSPVVISRSDSTLRGHFPNEVDAMAKALDQKDLPYLIIPFFLEGGRLTIDDIHYVAEKDELVPAGQTPYARDAAFGFESSDLKEWVEEKTCGRVPAKNVVSVSLRQIREGGPDKVAQTLSLVPLNGACIINAVSYEDMEVLVAALLKLKKSVPGFLFRTAASFVRVYTGTQPRTELLSAKDLSSGSDRGGLFVVGSYVPKTTAQLGVLVKESGVNPVELEVGLLLDSTNKQRAVQQAIDVTNKGLSQGKDMLVYTSRQLVTGTDAASSLDIGNIVSQSLVNIVKGLSHIPRYLVAKGGITSSDIATQGLGVKRAMVQGQILPGVPVWKLESEARFPGMSYIIFPGNVGDDDALAVVQKKLAKVAPC